MTDRELLEKAAKAAEIAGKFLDDSKGGAIVYSIEPEFVNEQPVFVFWRPLTDDGDAFRLAVQLKIVWVYRSTFVVIEDGTSTIGEPLGYDPQAATRRAIVRAAAAIGEAMP